MGDVFVSCGPHPNPSGQQAQPAGVRRRADHGPQTRLLAPRMRGRVGVGAAVAIASVKIATIETASIDLYATGEPSESQGALRCRGWRRSRSINGARIAPDAAR